jgi:hypothetical protein
MIRFVEGLVEYEDRDFDRVYVPPISHRKRNSGQRDDRQHPNAPRFINNNFTAHAMQRMKNGIIYVDEVMREETIDEARRLFGIFMPKPKQSLQAMLDFFSSEVQEIIAYFDRSVGQSINYPSKIFIAGFLSNFQRPDVTIRLGIYTEDNSDPSLEIMSMSSLGHDRTAYSYRPGARLHRRDLIDPRRPDLGSDRYGLDIAPAIARSIETRTPLEKVVREMAIKQPA